MDTLENPPSPLFKGEQRVSPAIGFGTGMMLLANSELLFDRDWKTPTIG